MPSLLGRSLELEALDAALDAVARGGSRLVLVRGEAGIGKTAVLSALRVRAVALRFVVCEGRASELERDVPLVPILDALGGSVPAFGSGAERWRAYRELALRVVSAANGRALLLLVDDVHWADPATIEFLDHLLRRPPEVSLLLALGLRPSPVADRLIAARRASGAIELVGLDLAPLGREVAEALLAEVPGAVSRDRVFEASGGNPLLLQELARSGGGAVPGGIVAAVQAEVAALPEDAQRLLRAGAIAGDPFDLDLAAGIADLDATRALGALDVIEATTLVRGNAAPDDPRAVGATPRVGGDAALDDPRAVDATTRFGGGTGRDVRRFAFRHPVVRSAVYEGLGSGARLAGHAAAARVLAGFGAALPVRAHHLAFAAVPGDLDAARVLRTAAGDVRAQAPGVAADWLLAARRADPRGAELGELAETLVEAGRLTEALAIAGDSAEPRMAVAAASVERRLGRHDAARLRLRRALDAAATPEIAARVSADLAVAAYQRGEYAEMRDWAFRAADGTSGAVRAIAATLLAVGDAFAGEPTADLGPLIEAVADDELGALAEPAMAISWGLLALDRLPEGLAAARRIAAAARRSGNGAAAIPHDLAAVLALGLLGRFSEAEPLADAAEQSARVSGNAQLVQWALWLDAWVLLERGRLDPALAAATESVELAQQLDDSASAIVARAVLGAVLIARGSHAQGRPLVAAYDIDHGWVCRWAPVLVESDIALGDLAAAREHAARAAKLAPLSGMAGARAAAARAQALVALAEEGSGDAAEDGAAPGTPGETASALALQAIAEAEAAGAALEAARAQLLAGRALLAHDRDAGIAHLRAAEAAAGRCGAPRVAEEAVLALRQSGVRVGRGGPRAPGSEGLDALSPREREVAQLVAEGLTNREIGARLYLSEKTIETHLTRVFAKLGLRSRAQVAATVSRAA